MPRLANRGSIDGPTVSGCNSWLGEGLVTGGQAYCVGGISATTGWRGWLEKALEICCVDRQACSRAVAKACRLLKRCCGSLASAIITTCSIVGPIAGNFSRNGGGGTKRC